MTRWWIAVAWAAVGCAPAALQLDDDDTSEAPTPAGDDDDATGSDDDDVTGGDDDDSAVVGAPDELTVTPFGPCIAPVLPPGRFTDGTAASGVDFVHVTDPAFVSDPEDLMSAFAEVVAAGVVAADLDRDGAIDLYFPQTVGPNALYWGLGNARFTKAEGHGAELADRISGLANAADFDGDGDLDLLVGGRDHLRLLRNDGARRFEDITESVGLVQPDGWAGGASWADWDADGDLDLFAGGYVRAVDTNGMTLWDGSSAPNHLYRNDAGVFVDVTAGLGTVGSEDGAVLHSVWRDLDRDGDVDLVQVNDLGDLIVTTKIWENRGATAQGWSWRERGAESVDTMGAPMGALVRDLDGDGWPDLWFSDFGPFHIFRSLGPFSWVDVSLAWSPTLQLTNDDTHWSIVDVDLDGDGQPAIFVAFGRIPEVFTGDPVLPTGQPDRFLVQTNDAFGPFHFAQAQDDVFPSPLDGRSRGAAVADLNGDGVPDLIVPHLSAPPSILVGRCTANRRLVVRLENAQGGNRHGIGARVLVTIDGHSSVQEMTAGGGGTFSGAEPVLFFGAGPEPDARARVEVDWPRGATQVFEDVCTHCAVTVRREAPPPSGLAE